VEDNKLLWDQARYVDEATYCERIRRLKPERGDVILVREGSKKIGTALAVNFDDDFCLGQRMMMFRLRDGMLPEYFAYYIQSDNFKKQYKPLIGGSASPHLNISDIKRMRLPVCSPEEQKEVVGFIDVQSSFLDALEATISVEIEKAQALRQSILKHAFSGQLVAQDPADEPASILLQRIRAEKEESGNGRRKNNKNGKKEAA
jgi:type I restriction enzyme S subunit